MNSFSLIFPFIVSFIRFGKGAVTIIRWSLSRICPLAPGPDGSGERVRAWGALTFLECVYFFFFHTIFNHMPVMEILLVCGSSLFYDSI